MLCFPESTFVCFTPRIRASSHLNLSSSESGESMTGLDSGAVASAGIGGIGYDTAVIAAGGDDGGVPLLKIRWRAKSPRKTLPMAVI